MPAAGTAGNAAILVIEKTRQTIVAPLHHVLHNTRKIAAWKSGHV
jgi:hypothetical protein